MCVCCCSIGFKTCGLQKKNIILERVLKQTAYRTWHRIKIFWMVSQPRFCDRSGDSGTPPRRLADRAAQLSPRRFHIVPEVISVPWKKKKEKTVRFMVLGGRARETLKDSAAGFYCCCQPHPALPDFDRSPPDPWERQVSSRHWNRKWCCDSCG